MSLAQRMWKDPVWSKVISAAIIGGAGLIATGAHFGVTWAAAWVVLVQVGSFLNVAVNLPRWLFWLWLALTLAAVAFFVVLVYLARREEQKPTQPPKQKLTPQNSYTSDVLFKFKWRWNINAANKVWGVTMYCPECDHQLLAEAFQEYQYRQYRCVCENCRFSAKIDGDSPAKLYQKVELAAERKIRTGEWEQATKSIQH